MPDRETPTNASQAVPGDLFDSLPTPAHRSPSVDSAPPAPGSRRARRTASEPQGSAESAPTESLGNDDPDLSAAASPAGAAPSTARSSATTLDDLFAADHEQPGASGKKKRRTGCLVALIIVLAIIGGLVTAGFWAMNTYGDKINEIMGWGESKDWEPGLATGEALVTIRQGDTGSPVSTALYEAEVTKTEDVFYDHLVKEDPTFTFYPGVYSLQKKMTAAAALEALKDPANKMENSVGIAEGGTVESSLASIADSIGIPLEELEAAVKDPSVYGVEADSLEGWLFPAVYTFDPDVNATQVIQRMVDRTQQSLDSAGVTAGDEHRVLTIAAIIQREGRVDDFAKVSRVIQNRLDDGMKLQMDSTSQFGYGELHAGKLSTSEEAQFDDNPWNTYVHEGLPKGPIANPSDAAIDAALHPADGPWFYFVTINPQTGETVFSVTYEEHQAAIRTWREWCSAHPDQGC